MLAVLPDSVWLTKSNQCWLTKSLATIYIRNGVAHGCEVLGLQRLGEEVGIVVGGLDEGDRYALLLNELSRIKK